MKFEGVNADRIVDEERAGRPGNRRGKAGLGSHRAEKEEEEEKKEARRVRIRR